MIEQMLQYMLEHRFLIVVIAVVSAAVFVLTLAALPFFFVLIPEDFFVQRQVRFPLLKHSHPFVRVLVLVLKNTIGLFFLISGFLMLFLPGQGILTLLMGLVCIDFAGKRTLILKLIGNKKVTNSITRLRAQFGRKPLRIESDRPVHKKC